jgi:ABC-type transport system involved in multi-copper enzyme maturation permease subunit
MRFIALVRQQLQEILGSVMAVMIVFILLGGFVFLVEIRSANNFVSRLDTEPGYWVNDYAPSPLRPFCGIVLFESCMLGVALAFQQFAEQHKRGTWAFTIHRPAERSTILWARFTAAAITFIAGVGLFWSFFYLYALKPGIFPYPPSFRTFVLGWAFMLIGVVVYFGVVLSSVSTKKKYTTKFFGVCFAIGASIVALLQYGLVHFLAVILISLAILVSDVVDTFLNRDF